MNNMQKCMQKESIKSGRSLRPTVLRSLVNASPHIASIPATLSIQKEKNIAPIAADIRIKKCSMYTCG